MPLDDINPEVSYKLTVVIAEEMAVSNLIQIFENLQPEHHPDVEFLLCTASDTSLLSGVPQAANVRVLPAEPDSRIPLLWRDGIRTAKADNVALTTAQCIPSRQWLGQLLEYDLSENLVAVGGAIDNIKHDNPVGSAVYLLRYVNFTKVRASGEVHDIAADNALYRKADILRHEDLLDIGFWEPSFHKRFISDGMKMRFDNELTVVHRNRYSIKQFMNQRFSHGMEFGMERARSMTLAKRLMMIGLSPLIPLVFLRKIMDKARLDDQFKLGFNLDFFWLLIFILAWALGETIGYGKKSGI
jgi:hypothetical protein